LADVAKHTRVLDTLTGPLERPALKWLAERMPLWVTPDVLTWIGVSGSVLVFAGYALTTVSPDFLWLATAGLVVNWFGDSLDGTLARVRHIERPRYGFYVDHTVDVVSESLIALGLGLSPYVSFDLAALALIGYLAMSVLVYVRTVVDGVFKISYSLLGPTEVRIVLVAVNVALYVYGNPMIGTPWGEIGLADAVVALVAAALFLIFVGTAISGMRRLAGADSRTIAEGAAQKAADDRRPDERSGRP
jgi:phosphatidylglycerophosphate synthase